MISNPYATQVLLFTGIIKINNHEATPTGSESPKRKKSVKFATDCNATAEEVKNHEKNEYPAVLEATNNGEPTFEGCCDDSLQSPQQQAEFLVEESNQADGAGERSLMEAFNEVIQWFTIRNVTFLALACQVIIIFNSRTVGSPIY